MEAGGRKLVRSDMPELETAVATINLVCASAAEAPGFIKCTQQAKLCGVLAVKLCGEFPATKI